MSAATALKPVWNAADYAAHSAVQLAWARELITRLRLRGDEHVLDIGCGDGKVTAEIARAVPRGRVLGLDASAEMIRYARKAFPSPASHNLTFRVADARTFRVAGPFDLVFSNATLHWVDDHQAFLRRAAAALRAGGRLCLSGGGKGNAHDVFLALRPELRLARWRGCFRRMPRPYFFYPPENYARWLPAAGLHSLRVELSPRDATFAGPDGFAAWLRTTWLPYLQRVPEDRRDAFLAAVTARYLARHPADRAGLIHVRMVRLEIDAVKI